MLCASVNNVVNIIVVMMTANTATRLRPLFFFKLRFVSVPVIDVSIDVCVLILITALLIDPAVFDPNAPVGLHGNLWIVGDHDDRLIVFLAGNLEKFNNFLTGLAVQISCRHCSVSTT